MWILKFTNWHKTCVIRPLCVKHDVTDLVYLINQWQDKEHWYYTELHILQGSSEAKKKFLHDMKKDPTTKNIEPCGEHIITLNARPITKKFYSTLFDPRIIHVKPVVQRADGFEDWELASWDKEPLMKVLKIPEFEIKVKCIQQEHLQDIFLPHIHPKLPPKQREAIELAVKEGYYDVPRLTDIAQLAKIAKISRPTFQEHLQRAEKKLVPFLVAQSQTGQRKRK